MNDFNSAPTIAGYGSPYIMDVYSNAICLDCNSPSAPSWTASGTGGTVVSWIAFTNAQGSYSISQPITVANRAVPGTATNCSPTCTLTIPSTSSGNLLRVFAVDNAGSHYISSVSDGTNSFTVPSSCESTKDSAGLQSNCAYLLSSNSGKTSLSITMTGNSTSVYFSYWEVHKPTGSWTLDSGSPACTLNSSGTYTPAGQVLTFNNTILPHIEFQSITASGGVGGATNYPWQFNSGSLYVGQMGGAPANISADLAILNTTNNVTTVWTTPEENTMTTGVCGEAFY